jgi:hypothetical protein
MGGSFGRSGRGIGCDVLLRLGGACYLGFGGVCG